MANFEQLKGPMKIRAQLVKSCGLHVKDLIGSTAHITNAPLSLRHPDEEDLENLIGWNPAVRYAGNENRDGIYERLDRLEEMLSAWRSRCPLSGYPRRSGMGKQTKGNLTINLVFNEPSLLTNHWFQ